MARNLRSGCGKYRYAVEDCMVLSLPFRKKSIVHLLKYIKIVNLYLIQPLLANNVVCTLQIFESTFDCLSSLI